MSLPLPLPPLSPHSISHGLNNHPWHHPPWVDVIIWCTIHLASQFFCLVAYVLVVPCPTICICVGISPFTNWYISSKNCCAAQPPHNMTARLGWDTNMVWECIIGGDEPRSVMGMNRSVDMLKTYTSFKYCLNKHNTWTWKCTNNFIN